MSQRTRIRPRVSRRFQQEVELLILQVSFGSTTVEEAASSER
jgi:hypothetical protein